MTLFLMQQMCFGQASTWLGWPSLCPGTQTLYPRAQMLLLVFHPLTTSPQVGTEWRSPWNRCIVNECVRVNNEVFVQQKNVSCSHIDVPDCPEGTELRCDQVIDCCPSCRCGKVWGMTNGITPALIVSRGDFLFLNDNFKRVCFASIAPL